MMIVFRVGRPPDAMIASHMGRFGFTPAMRFVGKPISLTDTANLNLPINAVMAENQPLKSKATAISGLIKFDD